eukprot:6492049-Amphidinium_carterae.2
MDCTFLEHQGEPGPLLQLTLLAECCPEAILGPPNASSSHVKSISIKQLTQSQMFNVVILRSALGAPADQNQYCHPNSCLMLHQGNSKRRDLYLALKVSLPAWSRGWIYE